jgi:hypothetical protein
MWRRIKSIFSLDSIGRRVRAAFLSIVLLLIFAGGTSLLELERVSHDTQLILEASKQNVDIAREMASALSDQNDAIIYMAVVGDSSQRFRTDSENSILRLKRASEEAFELLHNTEYHGLADSLTMHTDNLNTIVRDYLDGNVQRRIEADMLIDTLPNKLTIGSWYVDEYKTEHRNLSKQISKYMTGSQSTLGPEVSRLSHTARRAVTPVFISLLVMFIVVLMLYFFLKRLYIKPMTRINRSLGDYITYRVPFDDSIECRDEIKELRDRISTLTSKVK